MTKYRVSASYCPPIVIRRICALPASVKARYDVSSIRVIVAGATKWSYRLKLEYHEFFLPTPFGSSTVSELGSNIVMRPGEHWSRPESSAVRHPAMTWSCGAITERSSTRPICPVCSTLRGPTSSSTATKTTP